MRRIRLAVQLFPGQVKQRPNQRPPFDAPITRAQLVSAHTRFVLQAGSIWQPFVIEESGRTLELGHMLGLASRSADGGIMGRRFVEGRCVRRSLNHRDKELVHLAVESRVPGGSVATHVVRMPSVSPSHRGGNRVRVRD